jgi:hypothetical protein
MLIHKIPMRPNITHYETLKYIVIFCLSRVAWHKWRDAK